MVYLVTKGLRSQHTRASYQSAFRQFKKYVDMQDERILINYKPSVIEQKIIGYLEMLVEKGRAQMTIELHKAALFHFFEMNDILLNRRKISRFVREDESDDADDDSQQDRLGPRQPLRLQTRQLSCKGQQQHNHH